MAGIKGDFTGFSFGDKHSSTLGITRVADGDFYNDVLSPTFNDKTTQVNGADFTYYFGTNYTQRVFDINFAFDSLTEAELRILRQTFSTKKLVPLVFDEAPYKKYMVKCANAPQIQYVCFDTDPNGINNQRIYRGSGTLNLIAYYPFGIGLYQTLEQVPSSITNIAEWSSSNVLPASLGTSSIGRIKLKNTGDLPMEYYAYFEVTNPGTAQPSLDLGSIMYNNLNTFKMTFDTSKKSIALSDYYIRINSRANLIEGCDSNKQPTGQLYNQWITTGSFFKIPVHNYSENETDVEDLFISRSSDNSYLSCNELQYNYIYF